MPLANSPSPNFWEFTVSGSSTERLYGVYWSTNLVTGPWSSDGTLKTGTGVDLLLQVTNAPARNSTFYRTGVSLP